MHELSLAQAMVERVLAHVPAGTFVTLVRVQAGPLQNIEPLAMQLAWDGSTQNTVLEQSKLDLHITPWKHHCLDCQREWESDTHGEPCSCGSTATTSAGNAELTLQSIDVEETPAPVRTAG